MNHRPVVPCVEDASRTPVRDQAPNGNAACSRYSAALAKGRALVEEDLAGGPALPHRVGPDRGDGRADVGRAARARQRQVRVEGTVLGLVAQRRDERADRGGNSREVLRALHHAEPQHPRPPLRGERAATAEPHVTRRHREPAQRDRDRVEVDAVPRNCSVRCHWSSLVHRAPGAESRTRATTGETSASTAPGGRTATNARATGQGNDARRIRNRFSSEIVENCRMRSRSPGMRIETTSVSWPGTAIPNHTVPTGWPSCSSGPATPVTEIPTSAPEHARRALGHLPRALLAHDRAPRSRRAPSASPRSRTTRSSRGTCRSRRARWPAARRRARR